jgi:crotonobetainyl-CoA:carnitine CoA-transferase CaiB-like acyl-CoA transferase
MSRAPLEGLRVIELTTAWAGPMAGRILACLGADVTHVESPTRTNSWRQNKGRPSPVCYPDFEPGERFYDRSFLFNSQNVNKRSMGLDLKKPAGLEVMRKLLDKADVLLCNFRPGMLKRLGLDRETLAATNPGIIVAEMPAFGLDGPHCSYAALGPTMEMAAGMSAMIAYPGGKPTVTGPSYLDPIGGFNAAAAVLTALVHRQATGEGQHVEVSQVEAAMQFIGPELLAAAESGEDAVPDGNHVDWACPHNCYPAAGEDAWIVIAAEDDDQWRALCHAMERPGLASDPDYATLEGRRRNEAALDVMIAEWTASQDKHTLAARLQEAGIAAAPVNTPKDVSVSPYLAARGFFTELDHPLTGRHRYPGLPFHLQETSGSYRSAAPLFGADNRHILQDVLGYSNGEVAALEADRTIAATPDKEA